MPFLDFKLYANEQQTNDTPLPAGEYRVHRTLYLIGAGKLIDKLIVSATDNKMF